MQITIHRGLNQIGGNVVEIATAKTKILFDAGMELESMEETECERTELDFNKLLSERDFAAVFISHYHADHVGLLKEAKKLPPVYMGEMAFKLFKATEEYKKQTVNFTPSGYLQNQLPIHVGDIAITPLLSDHSAFDSYSFVIEADENYDRGKAIKAIKEDMTNIEKMGATEITLNEDGSLNTYLVY